MTRFRSLAALVLVAGLGWLAPAAAADSTPRFTINSVVSTGCATSATVLQLTSSNFGADEYIIRTRVWADGKQYMDEAVSLSGDGLWSWGLYSSFTYEPATTPGTFPLPQDTPVYVQLDVERPKGTVHSSQRLSFDACNTGAVLFQGEPRCPGFVAETPNGCPPIERTLTMGYHRADRALVGALFAPGHPEFHTRRAVTVWKVRPGPDRKVTTVKASPQGTFLLHPTTKGRYYATSAAVLIPTTGEAAADETAKVRVG